MSKPSETGRCAVCGKPQQQRFTPFCSRRCADVDLGRWLKGSYAIPGAADEEKSAENPPVEDETGDD